MSGVSAGRAGAINGADPELVTRVIRDESGWDAIRSDWNDLHVACPWSSPPLHFDWLRGWWDLYGAAYGQGGLRIVTVWRGSRCVGALPLYLARRSIGRVPLRELRPISTGEAEHEEICPDYMNLLCRPGGEVACVRSVWDELGRMAWDRLELMDLPQDSPLLGIPGSIAGRLETEVIDRGVCPVADLSGGFEAYLKELSSKTRQHARQYVRAGERPGAAFELATASSADEFFDDLVRLHQERWTADGQPGCFASARFTEFHRRLVRAWVPTGRAVLARLSHEGRAYCVLYGFLARDKCDYYQSGVTREDSGPFDSPGNTANLMLMRALAERGVRAYDFLRGTSGHKQRWATREVPLLGLQAQRPTLRSAVARSILRAGRLVRDALTSRSPR